MNINFKKKITSRKLWAALVGVVVGLAAAFGLDESEWTQIAGVVGSIVSIVAYIFGEAKMDAAASVPVVLPANIECGKTEKDEYESAV